MLPVGFRPEECQEGVPAVKPSWGGHSQVGEEGDPFGLSQDGRHLTPGLNSRGEPAKQSKLDVRESRRGRKAAVAHAARLAFKECGGKGIVLLTQRNARSRGRQRRIPPDFTLGSRRGNARELEWLEFSTLVNAPGEHSGHCIRASTVRRQATQQPGMPTWKVAT